MFSLKSVVKQKKIDQRRTEKAFVQEALKCFWPKKFLIRKGLKVILALQKAKNAENIILSTQHFNTT